MMRWIWLIAICLLVSCDAPIEGKVEQVVEEQAAMQRPTLEVPGFVVDGTMIEDEVPIFESTRIDTTNRTITELMDEPRYMQQVYSEVYTVETSEELRAAITDSLASFHQNVAFIYKGEEDPYAPYFYALTEVINMNDAISATFLGYSQAIEPIEGGYFIHVHNDFTTNKIEMVTIENELEARIDALGIRDKSRYEQIKTLYTYVMEHMTYVDNDTLADHSPMGLLRYGEGVCQAYAVSLKLMFDLLDIPNRYIVGEVQTAAGTEYHAWNLVELDGAYYHLDATWDDTADVITYDYFLVSDETMYASRTWEAAYYEAAPKHYAQ